MAGDGIGILGLQGIVVGVGLQPLDAFGLRGDIGIVLQHGVEEAVGLLAGQGRCIATEGVQQEADLLLAVVVVGKSEGDVGKAEPIQLARAAHSAHDGHLAVGDEVRAFVLLRPIVIVLGHHQDVARLQLFFPPKDALADALVVDVGTLVAAADDDGLVHPVAGITLFQGINQFVAGHKTDVVESLYAQAREGEDLARLQGTAQPGGVPEDARCLLLPDDLRQVGHADLQPISAQVVGLQGGALLLAHGWQLGHVARQQQAASLSGVDKMYQVVQEPPCAEHRPGQSLVGNHGSLVHDEEGVGGQIVVQREVAPFAGEGTLAVDALVDGVGGMRGVGREDLCRPSRGSQQDALLLQRIEGMHQRADERGLARAGIAAQDECTLRTGRREEGGQTAHGQVLVGSGRMGEVRPDLFFQILVQHSSSMKIIGVFAACARFFVLLRCEYSKTKLIFS